MRVRPLSDFVDQVPIQQRAVAPNCCLCKKLVNRVFAAINRSADGVLLTFRCHNRSESLFVPAEDIRRILDGAVEVFDVLPRNVFWPGFSRYSTTTKPPRRVL